MIISSIRTDLAIEAKEYFEEENKRKIPGIEIEVSSERKNIKVTKVQITDEIGSAAIGKPIGNYITIETPDFKNRDIDLMEDVSRVLAGELIKLADLKEDSSVLIVGLGNWNITPDALGPKVAEKVMVTRHITEYVPEQIDDSVRPVSAISPGVLGITGIETGEIVQGIINHIKPDLIIAIDALASRKMDRINSTIQISDTGINPGSGVGNNRKELSENSLGVRVIAIGIPTVVDAATMANDTIDMIIEGLIKEGKNKKGLFDMLNNLNREEKTQLINEVFSDEMKNLMVTPKEIDSIIEDISDVIADGLNISLHPGIHMDDLGRFLN